LNSEIISGFKIKTKLILFLNDESGLKMFEKYLKIKGATYMFLIFKFLTIPFTDKIFFEKLCAKLVLIIFNPWRDYYSCVDVISTHISSLTGWLFHLSGY